MAETPEPPAQPALVQPSRGARWTGATAELAAPLSAVAHAGGWREKVRFEQSMHGGGDYVLYSPSIAGEMVLSVAVNSNTPLGIVRYHTRRTAETIQAGCLRLIEMRHEPVALIHRFK